MTVDKDRQAGSTQPKRDPEPDGEGVGRINMHGDVAAGGFQSVIAAGARELERQLGSPLTAGLYLVATPIGNLGDITLRALAVLARADVIYCEDTRHSRTLLQHFSLRAPLKSYHEHNAAAQRPRIVDELASGARVVLISDAGTPLISDPGYKLVRDVVAAGHAVISLPGASAVLAALTQAGLPSDAFLFAGFLPTRSAARKTHLETLKRVSATLIFYEAPSRIADTLADLNVVLGPRQAAVARELTKRYEEVIRGSLQDLAARVAQQPARGEYAIVVGPPVEMEVSDQAIEAALSDVMRDMRLKDAAKTVAEALGVARKRVYDIGLKLKGERET